MSEARIRVSHLHFSWPDGTPVLADLSFALGSGCTGLVAPNGVGKSTLLKLFAGILQPRSGNIEIHGSLGYLPQQPALDRNASVAGTLGIADRLTALDAIESGDADPAHFDTLGNDWNVRERAAAMLGRLGLAHAPLDRKLTSFSGGEAMSLALAAQLLRQPDVLLLDEPTNHLDRTARTHLHRVLEEFPGCLLVASHDRELLRGMDRIAELGASSLRIYGGDFDFYRQAVDTERQAAEQRVRNLRSDVKREQRERQQGRERAQRRAGNAARHAASGGLPRIVANARAGEAQAAAGKADEIHESRLAQARTRLRQAAGALEETVPLDFDLPATRVAADRVLFSCDGLRIRHGERDLFGSQGITLTLRGPQRIALTGANGSGKSSLLRIITGELEPAAGNVRRSAARIAYLPQRFDPLDPARDLADNFARFAPAMPAPERANLIARLGFRGARMHLPVAALSGGERLRLALACVLHTDPAPQLLLLDEPTNNLDMDSVAQLEQALRAYRGALVAVSHDEAFLEAIGITRRLMLAAQELRELSG
ncbi:MAG: ABC-F family ATP-binding cassette domain-containing protein [Lysobacteraceae bacterium]